MAVVDQAGSDREPHRLRTTSCAMALWRMPRRRTRRQAVRRFYAVLAAEPRVTATAMQTVGVKGYDGFAVILVTG